jgi:DNA polymerases epsilon N terminal
MDRTVLRAFKLRGLSLSGDASRALSRVLSAEEDPNGSLERVLDEIKERIEKREIKSSLIDVDAVTSVVAYLSSSEEDLQQESTQLFDAFNSPKIVFEERSKTYRVDPTPTYRLHGAAESRSQMFRERLLLTQQRLLRSGVFVTRTMGQGHTESTVVTSKGYELATIESLLGSVGSKVLFGMLTQVRLK